MCTAVGPLADSLFALSLGELDALSSLVGQIRSCYTGSDALGRGFVGTDSLRAGGARVVVVLPLWANRTRVGSAVLAHSRPLQLSGEEVRPLEMLADHVAAVLVSSTPVISPVPTDRRSNRSVWTGRSEERLTSTRVSWR